MWDSIFNLLIELDSIFWSYIAFLLIMLLGICLTVQSRFFQFYELPSFIKTFVFFLRRGSKDERGIHPLKAFFASVGGMIGVGNIVAIVTAVKIGGPGALFWVWVAGCVGAVIKYAEIYLGLKHRVQNERGGYDGGPMFFLRKAFNVRWISTFVAVLLCVYGVEIYQFAVVTDTLSYNFSLNRYLVIGVLLFAVLYTGVGGVVRLGKVCTAVMPLFIICYVVMSLWIIFHEIYLIPEIIQEVFVSAFTGHAAVGGFAGSSVFLAIQHGISRAAYSADIGIGYDSIIQSESNTVYPESQARLAVLGVCIDNLVCTLSILLVLISGTWKAEAPIEGSQLVQTALSAYFPYMEVFMPIFLFVAGYTTIIAYFCVGMKCARFLFPRYGTRLYILFAIISLIFFSFFDQSQALLVMSVAGALLLITNLLGIFILRHQVVFHSYEERSEEVSDAENVLVESC